MTDLSINTRRNAALHLAGTRQPAVAGTFYPVDPAALAKMVEECVNSAPAYAVRAKALIAPHAGLVFSGPIAGTAYRTILERRSDITRVVILGPPHRQPVRGFAVPSVSAFATPFGEVTIDRDTCDVLSRMPDVEVDDAPHVQEHCIEVHLPFLQAILGSFSLVPILVGDAAISRIDEVLATVWGGDETLVVISSDLSHFHDYGTAQGLDADVARAIETLKPDDIADEQACGRNAVKGLLARCAALDLRPTTLDVRNSGDTAGEHSRERVVGYGAWSFEYAAQARLPDAYRAQLIKAARQSIQCGIANGQQPEVDLAGFARPLLTQRAAFVTLTLGDTLRGCVGSVQPRTELVTDVVNNAFRAAFEDPRFAPLTTEEAEHLSISISVLSHLRPMTFSSEADAIDALHPDVDGVVMQAVGADGETRAGLFLPSVWAQLPDPRAFMRHLKAKAGLPVDFWSTDVRLWRYGAESFH
ncbi:MAG: AmmeMemoRadiSam system protein B [Chromatiales bacterium]|jgi:MEMO1 family protein|nr:AmmeMemoRadiSam system protein B [Chromatiales bacterium]